MGWQIWQILTNEKLVLLSSFLRLGFGFKKKWKSKLPQWNTGRVYMISYNIYGVERYGLLCNGNRNFRIDEKFGKLICKDNGFQKLDFISSNQTEYFDFITEEVGPYAGIYFENNLYGTTLYQCLPDFTVGGAECPEGARDMNDCDIDDYARHGGNCLKQFSSIFIHCSEYFDSDGLSEGEMIDSSYVDYTCSRNCGEELLSIHEKFCFGPDHEEKNQMTENPKDNTICINSENWLSISHCEACDELSFYQLDYYQPDYDYGDYGYKSTRKGMRSGDESWRRETKCPIPEIAHDPKRYCPDEWPCHLKTKYCGIEDCDYFIDEFYPYEASFNSVIIIAILGCLILVVAVVLAWFYCIRRKTHDREKTSLRKNPKRTETSKSTKPLLNDTIQEQRLDEFEESSQLTSKQQEPNEIVV